MIGAKVTVDSAETTNKFPQFMTGEFGFNILITPYIDVETVYPLTDEVVTLTIRNINKKVPAVDEEITYDAESVCTYLVKDGDFSDMGIYEVKLVISKTGEKARELNMGTFAVFDN